MNQSGLRHHRTAASLSISYEFGHVLCNSWQFFAKPQLPAQWLEEEVG
jgi:hypothetical protein